MTRVIYLDSLLFLNFILDYVLIALTADLCGLYCSRKRQAAAALLGAMLAVGLYLAPSGGAVGMALRLAGCLTICRAAFPRERGRGLARCCGLLFLLTIALAGMVGVLVLINSSTPAEVHNGVVWLAVPVWKQAAASMACWCLVRTLLHSGSLSDRRKHREITIREGDNDLKLRAFVDTGNFLRDPVSGRRVILVDPDLLEHLLPIPREREPLQLLESLSAYGPRFSLMQYSTADRLHGMLVIWRPSAIMEADRLLEEYVVGISPAPLRTGDGCRAIIGG